MTILKINDLPATEDLERLAMAAIHGGAGKPLSPYNWSPFVSLAKTDFSFDAAQMLGQTQNTVVNNGNNAAFVSDITASVKPTQNGANTINFGF